MKRILVLGFVFLYMLAMIRPIFPLFNYLINQDYIAEFLCINKNKPELQCNGKCQLSMQLKKQAEEKKKNVPRIQLEDYPIGFVFFITFKAHVLEIKSKNIFFFINNYTFIPQFKIFHPPSFV